ncbi:MAG: hypothetical protein P9L99_10740 [Candidatus Lernaella stagnicola]|nr:hypothetical protein [Candidatus Lernaella stagnicola]
MKKLALLVSLVALLACGSMMACDEAEDAIKELADVVFDGEVCLNDLLEYVGLTRDDLGEAADEAMEELLAAQEDVLGAAYIIDCQAKEKAEDLSDPTGDPPTDEGAPPAEEGENRTADSAGDVPGQIRDIIDERGGNGSDTAILLDATGSMWDDQAAVSSEFNGIIAEVQSQNGNLAIAWYKDRDCDNPWYDVNSAGLLPMADAGNRSEITGYFDSINVVGGCDWPESLYDGVWETATGLAWTSTTARMIIVITDADALTPPRSTHSEAETQAKLAEEGITLHTIFVPITF